MVLKSSRLPSSSSGVHDRSPAIKGRQACLLLGELELLVRLSVQVCRGLPVTPELEVQAGANFSELCPGDLHEPSQLDSQLDTETLNTEHQLLAGSCLQLLS